MEVKVSWHEGLRFVGRGPSGHAVLMDGAPEVGGEDSAPRPTELLLIALGGCTGMDVVSILQKMRTPPRRFWVEIRAERAPDHPRAVRKVHLKYVAEGVPEENLRRAAQLSQERYCSVSHSLAAELTFEVQASP
ncbi:MAG: OsmC family protein [Candidatus Bipolaricaulota bacterium]|nr:OsmC family protein [Candidatus Bipolaricaulota bacterium]MCX7844452.1 OsmC family protein [Candidatus Bipolaricaulota bacterium]MDW8152152.1 OsmC family protein [Candidatus Bipolaricaulota bacterium]